MAMYPVQRTVATVDNFFNPYAGLAPPSCCYCAPVGIPVPPEEMAAQQVINVQVTAEVTSLLPGLTSLAFVTKTEDAARMLARGRIEAERRGLSITPGTAEMGAGPYSFTRNQLYIP